MDHSFKDTNTTNKQNRIVVKHETNTRAPRRQEKTLKSQESEYENEYTAPRSQCITGTRRFIGSKFPVVYVSAVS